MSWLFPLPGRTPGAGRALPLMSAFRRQQPRDVEAYHEAMAAVSVAVASVGYSTRKSVELPDDECTLHLSHRSAALREAYEALARAAEHAPYLRRYLEDPDTVIGESQAILADLGSLARSVRRRSLEA